MMNNMTEYLALFEHQLRGGSIFLKFSRIKDCFRAVFFKLSVLVS